MSLKKNILANYIGQFYIALIGIILVPVYLKYMGAEAYGLVGFFAMMQTWFFMLDMGLTPTMARETARFEGGAVDALNLRRLLRALEGIFVVIAVLGAAAIMFSTDFIAGKWLKISVLPMREVENSLVLMALIISLRWMGGLYRSAINGFERLVWLNAFGIVIATLRFVLIVPVLIYIGSSPTIFFGYQLIVTIFEISILLFKAYKLLPAVEVIVITWDWEPLRSSLSFSLVIAFTGMVWVLVTQTDKLILSGMIPLADYAYYTLAVLVASGIMIISKPISGAILPRLTKLNAEGNQPELMRLYRTATQSVAAIAIPASLILSIFSEEVLFAWTGDYDMARKAAPILFLYALGNGVMVLAAFPYYLQYAKGDLRMHLIGNALFVVFFVPSIFVLVMNYGAVGAGYAWITSNLLFFLCYLPIVHNKFAKGLHLKWLAVDVGFVAILPMSFLTVINHFITPPNGRVILSAYLITLLICSISLAAIGSSKIRVYVRNLLLKFMGLIGRLSI